MKSAFPSSAMRYDSLPRSVILGPVHLEGLKEHLSEGLNRGLPPGMGGYCVNALIDARLRRGWRTDVITLDPSINERILRYTGDLLRVWVVQRRPGKALRDGYAWERRLMHSALQEAAPELVHAQWTYEYGLAAVTQSLVPSVVTVHDRAGHCARWLGWKYWPLYVMSRYVMSRAGQLTAVSPDVRASLGRRFDVPVIPNLVPKWIWRLGEQRSSITSGDGRTIRVVSAVNWSRLKNVRRALESIRSARQLCREKGVGLDYQVMGPGMEPGGPAQRWACKASMDEGVRFLGVLAHEQAVRTIAASDVLFHPSHEEAMPGPVCEAMAIGVPVVACREAAGCRWLCADGRGYLCNGYSVDAMAVGIVTAGASGNVGRGHAAREWLRTLTNEDRILEALSQVYIRVLGRGKS